MAEVEGADQPSGRPAGRRVLVVDDLAQMRAVIGRALGTAGYHVDVASSLAQARALDPAGYDAVLVDANLGGERGTELVEELLLSHDPARAARCLVITGGTVEMLPAGVAVLAKHSG